MRPARKPVRQWLLLLHVVLSVGWLGARAGNLVIAVDAARTASPDVRRVCYELVDRLDFALVIPLAFRSLASGVLISVATKWGLVRLAKLALTLAVIAFSTFGLGVWVETSVAATARSDAASPAAVALVVGAAGNIVVFLFMTWASITKPWPRTPWFIRRGSDRPPPPGQVDPAHQRNARLLLHPLTPRAALGTGQRREPAGPASVSRT